MESMDGDDLELLFSELDTDGDGLVTLEEFLSGLFGADTPRTTEFESVFENDDEEKSIDQSTSSSSTRSPDTSSRGSRTSRNSRTSKRKRLPSVVANSPVRLVSAGFFYIIVFHLSFILRSAFMRLFMLVFSQNIFSSVSFA